MRILLSHAVFNRVRTASFPCVVGLVLSIALIVEASGAELRILSFDEELGRARSAIGQAAECRVTIEGMSAECRELKTVQGLPALARGITIGFAPGQQKQIGFSRIQPLDEEFYNGISQQYGIPKDMLTGCTNGTAPPQYLGDYELHCEIGVLSIKYAKRF